MSVRANKVLKACENAYNKSGVQGAIDKAEKMAVKIYSYCVPCEASQPSIANTCCVCGSYNK